MMMDHADTADRIKFLIRDRDVLYPPGFDQVLADAGIRTVRSAVRAPRMNSIMERWVGSARRELLDRTLILNLPHLRRILHEYEAHHNGHRPRMALAGAAPDKPFPPEVADLEALPRSPPRPRHPRESTSRLICADEAFGKDNPTTRSAPEPITPSSTYWLRDQASSFR